MFDPWLYDRGSPASRQDQEAAQRAREAAGTLGGEFVTGQLADARRYGDQAARDAAQRLAGEAAAQREMQARIARGEFTSGQGYVPSVSPSAPVTRPQSRVAELAQEATKRAEKRRAQEAGEERMRQLRAREKQERTKLKLRLSRERGVNTPVPSVVADRSLLWHWAVSGLATFFTMMFAVLMLTGSVSPGTAWIPVLAICIAVAMPLAATWLQTNWLWHFGAIIVPPVMSLWSAGNTVTWSTFMWLVLSLLSGFVAFVANVVLSETYGPNARRDSEILRRCPACDYCGASPTVLVKSIPSKFDGDTIMVVACRQHMSGALWTAQLEQQLLKSAGAS